jgi:hypothetical protein
MIFSVAETEETVSFTPRTVIVAGFTGRNRAGVDAHIRELMDQGVRPPESVPAFYMVPPSLLSNAERIKVPTAESSGEAEPVLLCLSDSWYVAVGSDHTARDMERVDIGESKRACPKLVSTEIWPYEDVRRHWDEIIVRSWALVNGKQPWRTQTVPRYSWAPSHCSPTGSSSPTGIPSSCMTRPKDAISASLTR